MFLKQKNKVGERIEPKDNSQWYRKAINTRLSKIRNNEGRKATHIAEIKRLLVGLQAISPNDANEMSEKVANET